MKGLVLYISAAINALGNFFGFTKRGSKGTTDNGESFRYKGGSLFDGGFMPEITSRTHTPRTLSPEERAGRIAHRKQIRHNRQRLINKRGYA